MSYGIALALQVAVFEQLSSDAALAALIGDAIYDEVPAGAIPATYVALGAEVALDRSDQTSDGALHRFTVSVVSDLAGFAPAKAAAVAVSDALHNAELSLGRGHLVSMLFERAAASKEEAANLRRIDLRFAARVEDE